jgi:tRNA(Glu) U13 pseudouridine synthase TruD
VDEHGAYIRCAFELPRGSFATVVMRELMKPADALTDDDMNQ